MELAMESINELKRKGKIRSIGVSNFTLDMLKEASAYGTVDVIQPCYNLLWRYIDKDILPYCVKENIGVIPYSTLAQGLLTGRFTKDTQITGGRAKAALFQPGVYEECLEVTKIYSISGLLSNGHSLVKNRPFRAPHHNASLNALIGGGVNAMPGEVSLAHNGVLFLDELAEFSRKTLDALDAAGKWSYNRIW